MGLLQRRHVEGSGITYIGKESNLIEAVEQGLVHSWDEVLSGYEDAEAEWQAILLPLLLQMPRAAASQVLGLSERAISSLRNGKSRPQPATRRRMREYARQRLTAIS